MFEFISRNRHTTTNDNEKHDVTITEDEIYVDTDKVDDLDPIRTQIIHIKGNVDHLHINGSPTIIIHGNVDGNVLVDEHAWLTCNDIIGNVKQSKGRHIECINKDVENDEHIICD